MVQPDTSVTESEVLLEQQTGVGADGSRPFGAHLRMQWWKPLIVVALLPMAMLLLQIVFFEVAAALEGRGTDRSKLSPLQFLAVNLSMSVTGLLSVPLVAWFAHVPMRHIIRGVGRFNWRRVAAYVGAFAVIMAAANGAMAFLFPQTTNWSGFGFSGTTAAMLVIVLLTTPLTAAAEELMFRAAIMPALASWIRPGRVALPFGAIVSSLVFAFVHGSSDPWQFGYYTFFGLCMAVMIVLSRSLESAIAFHISHNLVTAILNTLLVSGGAMIIDRSTGAGGPHLLVLVPFLLAAVTLVVLRNRRHER